MKIKMEQWHDNVCLGGKGMIILILFLLYLDEMKIVGIWAN